MVTSLNMEKPGGARDRIVRLLLERRNTIEALASKLGVTENAVHVLKSRVKAKLRRYVDLGADDA